MSPKARVRALVPLVAMLLACPGSGPSAPGIASRPALPVAPSTDCTSDRLVWHAASKTSYTSYPAPGSEECIQYSGCKYEGQFRACTGTHSIDWVRSHNIISVFPDFGSLKLHDLCLRSGKRTIVATAYDTCADSDCDGCCSRNAMPSGNLIDVESFTDARWGVQDGQIEWADLGPTAADGCR